MSTTHHETDPTPADSGWPLPGAGVPAQRTAPGPASGSSRRPVVAAVAAALALVLAGGGFVAWRALTAGPKHPADSVLTLPAKLSALSALPADADPLKADQWQAKAKAALGTAPFAVQTYSGGSRSVRAVVARTDLSKKLEQAWAVDAGHVTDDVTCTQNVQLVAGGKAGVRPTLILCWRDTATLSAYVVVIDPKAKVSEADGVAALKQVWDAVS